MIEVKNQYVLVRPVFDDEDGCGEVVHSNERINDIPSDCIVHFDPKDATRIYINHKNLKAINIEKIFAIERKDR